MTYLLDTNVISEFTRAEPAQAAVDWMRENQEQGLFLSVITIGEIAQGIERLEPSAKKDRLQMWLEETVIEGYADFILPVDTSTMLLWGQLSGKRIREGRRLPVMDGVLAATALQHRLTVVTRNEADFAGLGVAVLNPFVRDLP